MKKELLDEVIKKLIPEDILTRVRNVTVDFPEYFTDPLSQYMIRSMEDPSELWKMRKQFALQLAATNFMTYVVCLSSRLPPRFHISRSTGLIAMSELLPSAYR